MSNLIVLQDVKMEAMIRGAQEELSLPPYDRKIVSHIEPISDIRTDNVIEFVAIKVQFFENQSPNWFVVRKRVTEQYTIFTAYKQATKKDALKVINRWSKVSKFVDEDNVCQVISFPKVG